MNAAGQHRAVALLSGGLDSMLAARLVMDQGVHVEGLNFFTGFCVEGHTHAIRNRDRRRPKRNNALWVAEQLGVRLHIIDVIEEYKDVVINPRHGYGANLNPCLDCKCFMVGKAREWMEAHGFDFIVTGEVIGQRPKSQLAHNFPVVERESGAGDRLLRPLCSAHRPPTLPQREGWVDCSKFPNFNGRGRAPQIELARRLGFTEWAQPAGGCCFLTDARYSAKLKDLWASRGNKRYELDDIMLLKVGRHVRPRPHLKLIVSRDEGEGNFLEGYRKRFAHLRMVSHNGPLTLLDGVATRADVELAARIAARYGQGRAAPRVDFEYVSGEGETRVVTVTPMKSAELDPAWLI